jgi:hypothetical protein
VVFPFTEVPDVPGLTNVSSPRLVTGHYSVIQSNGEKDRSTISSFPFKGGFDLDLNPTTLQGMFRYDEQKLVVDSNSLVDPSPKSVSYFQILSSEKTADASLTKVNIEAISESLIRCV